MHLPNLKIRTAFSIALGWALSASLLLADSPRIAVIGDDADKDLAALVTTELTANGGLTLIERDDLAKLGDELKLQQMAGSDAVALGKLVGADGLLFLNKTSSGIEVRFTAVGLGFALFDDPIPGGQDSAQLARSIAHRVAGYGAKLKLDPAQAVPLSVLNIRADYGTVPSVAQERSLTLLLESRLAALPEYVLLERRHGWSLGFEHSLDPASRPLLRGAYLIDGSLSLSAVDSGTDKINLRVRSPDGTQASVSAQGDVGHISALVDQLVAGIQKAVGRPVSSSVSSPGQEAQEYLREGLWGWRADALDAALEALDSAEVLGASIADVETIRLQVLYSMVDQGLERWDPWFDDEDRIPNLDSAALSLKTDAALRALRETVRYRDEKLEKKVSPTLSNDPSESYFFHLGPMRARGAFRVSKLLVLLDRANSPRADELRQALRSVTEYDPLHGHAGLPMSANINDAVTRSLFADNWAQSLDEELAYYHLVCADKVMAFPITQAWWSKSGFCARFFKTPEERQSCFVQFVETLKNDPQSRLSYLILKTNSEDAPTADQAYRDFLAELWSKREELAAAHSDSPLFHNIDSIPYEVKVRNGAAEMPLLHAFLTAPKIDSWSISPFKLLWIPSGFPESEAPALWREVNDYKEKLTAIWKAEGHSDLGLSSQLDPGIEAFQKRFPQVVAAPLPPAPGPAAVPEVPSAPASSPVPMVVTKFWHPWLTTGLPVGRVYLSRTASLLDDGVVLSGGFDSKTGDKVLIFKIGLPDLATTSIASPAATSAGLSLPTQNTGTKDGLYAIIGHEPSIDNPSPQQLGFYNLTTSTWTLHDLAILQVEQVYILDHEFYLNLEDLRKPHEQQETGIMHYDWEKSSATLLASSRRRPAQNQFDDRKVYHVAGIFLGPGHKPCLTTTEGIFYIQNQPGPWPEVFNGAFDTSYQVVTCPKGTLVFTAGGEMTLLEPDRDAPEYLMAPREPFFRKPGPDGKPPVKETTPWAGQTIWDPPGKDVWLSSVNVGYHGDSLFILANPEGKNGGFELLCYRKGKGRTPRRIPLRFQLDDAARALLIKAHDELPQSWEISKIDHQETGRYQQLIATNQGLCVELPMMGFWFLPYDEIENYLKTSSTTSH